MAKKANKPVTRPAPDKPTAPTLPMSPARTPTPFSPRLGDDVVVPLDTTVAKDPAPSAPPADVKAPTKPKPKPFDAADPKILLDDGTELDAPDLLKEPLLLRGKQFRITLNGSIYDHVADEPETGRWIYRKA